MRAWTTSADTPSSWNLNVTGSPYAPASKDSPGFDSSAARAARGGARADDDCTDRAGTAWGTNVRAENDAIGREARGRATTRAFRLDARPIMTRGVLDVEERVRRPVAARAFYGARGACDIYVTEPLRACVARIRVVPNIRQPSPARFALASASYWWRRGDAHRGAPDRHSTRARRARSRRNPMPVLDASSLKDPAGICRMAPRSLCISRAEASAAWTRRWLARAPRWPSST